MTRRRTRPVAVLAAVVLTAAACTGGSTSSAKPSRTIRGITATEVRIGGLGYASFYSDAVIGVQARIKRANDSGGVNGRMIHYVGFQDDGADRDRDAAAAKTLVEKQNVFALLPVVTPDLGAASYLREHRVPFFGWGIAPQFQGNTTGFGFTGSLTPPEPATASNAWGVVVKRLLGDEVAGKTVAIIGEDDASGNADVDVEKAVFGSAGFNIVYAEARIPPTESNVDFAPIAQAVLTSNAGQAPDVVVHVATVNNVLGLGSALTARGFHGVQTNQTLYDPRLAAPAAGSQVFLQFAPYEAAPTNPAVKQLLDDVKVAKPDQVVSEPLAAGYWAADMFLTLLQKAGRDLTAETLLRAANDYFSWDVPGTVGPSTWPRMHTVAVPCGALVAGTGAGFQVSVPFLCAQTIDLKSRPR
jgi:ABC-type branched-subunit amino acid transport system substrate-binding protein